MQNLFIFVPLVLFFVAYTVRDIFFATIVLMVATTVMLGVERWVTGEVRKMHLYITGLLLVLGTVTVALRNPVFIQWKVTIVHWIFAAILFVSQFAGKKPAVQAMMEMAIKEQDQEDDDAAQLHLTDGQWRGLNAAWGLYFTFVGFLNLFIAYRFEEAIWVKFKVFGILGLQLVFMVITMAWLFARMSSNGKSKQASDD